MKVKFFTSSYCAGCSNAKVAFAENNMKDVEIEELNVETQEGAKQATQLRITGGLPCFVNMETMDVFSGWHGSIDKFMEWVKK